MEYSKEDLMEAKKQILGVSLCPATFDFNILLQKIYHKNTCNKQNS